MRAKKLIPGERAVLAIAERRRWDLRRRLKGARAGKVEALHQFRVAGRRLRCVLPLVATAPEGGRVRRLSKLIRRLVRAAGRARDFDVSSALLRSEMARTGMDSGHRRSLLREFGKTHPGGRQTLGESTAPANWRKLRRRLDGFVRRRHLAELGEVLDRIRARSEFLINSIRTQIRSVGSRRDVLALHSIRREVRRFRYTLETGVAVVNGTARLTEDLRVMQEQLGMVHDAHGLAEWLHSRDGQDVEERQLEVRIRALERSQHVRWLRSKPEQRVMAVGNQWVAVQGAAGVT